MISVMITQSVRICCDRCGDPATEEWFATVEVARAAALTAGGFHESRWVDAGCHRELWLCPKCHEEEVAP